MLARLKEWRRTEAAEHSLPAYCVFTDATLVSIAESRPRSSAELVAIHGLGTTKASKYGESVLAIVAGEAGGQTPEETSEKGLLSPLPLP
jgi:DNA helicase-2/ATP-dependent DNA helicase PcrA